MWSEAKLFYMALTPGIKAWNADEWWCFAVRGLRGFRAGTSGFLDNSETKELHLVSLSLLGDAAEAGYLAGRRLHDQQKNKNPQLGLHFRFPLSEVFPAYMSSGP